MSAPGVRPANILLVDDHPIVRLGYIALLSQVDQNLCFNEAGNVDTAIELACRIQHQVALVDLSLAGVLSLDLIKRLRVHAPSMAILVVSMHDEKVYAERSIRAGARGYVMKQVASKSIIQAIRCVCEGRVWLSDAFRDELDDRLARGIVTVKTGGIGSLSNREMMVFRLIGTGLKKSEIAHELDLSPNTIETHRTNIKQKLGLATGAELYRAAFLHSREMPD